MTRSFSINSNIAAEQAQRQLGNASDALVSTFAKLSSGLRINSASDDAAGLAVSSSLKADTRVYSQGMRNLNDGVSALNIADGALANLSEIVIRMQELAEQAANGSLGMRQRASLNEEAQALAEEYSRISRTTNFNGLKLLDGTVQGLSLQMGYGSAGTLRSSLGGSMGTGAFEATSQADIAYAVDVSIGDLNGDGRADLVHVDQGIEVRLGNGDGTFTGPKTYSDGFSSSLALDDFNNDGTLDCLTVGSSESAFLRLGNGDGTFRAGISYDKQNNGSAEDVAIADINGDGALDFAVVGDYASVILGNGDGTFRAARSWTMDSSWSIEIALADLNGDGAVDLVTAGLWSGFNMSATVRLGNGDGSFRSSLSSSLNFYPNSLVVADMNGDAKQDLVTASGGCVSISLGNGDASFRSVEDWQMEANDTFEVAVADIDGDGALDLVTAGYGDTYEGRVTIRLGNGDGSFKERLSYQAEANGTYALAIGDLNGDGVPDIATGGDAGSSTDPTTFLAVTRDGVSPILPFSLTTQAGARQAIPVFQNTLNGIVLQRGEIGAFQSRLRSSLSTLGSTVVAYAGARSRIEDADLAQESASLLRQQILQQTASSVLAQANHAPSLALQLLQG